MDKPSDWKFASYSEDALCQYFANLFDFDFLTKKVAE